MAASKNWEVWVQTVLNLCSWLLITPYLHLVVILVSGCGNLLSFRPFWRGKRLVGFGRASSDGIYRAVLWDVVVAGDLQGRGLGRQVVKALLAAPEIQRAERVYLMTTNSSGFYQQLGFSSAQPQELLIQHRSTSG